MKKFYRLFILAISFLFFACNGLFLDSSLGKIVVQLPNGNSGNSRAAIQANADTVSYYLIILDGPTPKTVRAETGNAVIIDELEPGEYTVTVEAYYEGDKDYRIMYTSQTVTVNAGETSAASLVLKKGFVANTKFALWNYDSGSYNFKTFSSTPTNSDLVIPSGTPNTFTADANSVIEDNEGKVYYLNCASLYYNGNPLFTNFETDYQISVVSLYYDEKNDSIYGIGTYFDNSAPAGSTEAAIVKLSGEDVRKKIEDRTYSVPGTTCKLSGSGFDFADVNGGAVAITAFAIRGDDFYFVFKETDSAVKSHVQYIYHLYKATLTFSGSSANADCAEILVVSPSENGNDAGAANSVRGAITDITITSDGTAYALICDHSDFSISAASSNGVALETPIYSRGAIAKITSDGNVSYLGYHNNVRNLTTNVGNYNIDLSEETYYGSLKLYAPNKAQSSAEFYGPQKIIAKKPDELYIVDCGVNFMLAGFNPNNPAHNADSTGQEESGYHSGNAFIHNRIMKVDLKSFALGTVAEQVTVNSYNDNGSISVNTNDIFGCVTINGSTPFADILGYSKFVLCGPATLEDEI